MLALNCLLYTKPLASLMAGLLIVSKIIVNISDMFHHFHCQWHCLSQKKIPVPNFTKIYLYKFGFVRIMFLLKTSVVTSISSQACVIFAVSMTRQSY